MHDNPLLDRLARCESSSPEWFLVARRRSRRRLRILVRMGAPRLAIANERRLYVRLTATLETWILTGVIVFAPQQ